MTPRAATGRAAAAALAAGGVAGIDLLGRCLALATLLFAGPLGAGAVPALAVFCATTAIGTLVAMVQRGAPLPVLVTVQLAPVAVLSPAIGALADQAAAGAMPAQDALVTGVAILGTGSLACAAAMAAFAAFDLGRLVRMLPYPVTAGFMAATGALLVIAGARLALAAPPGDGMLAALADPARAARPTPVMALALAVAMALLARRWAGLGPVLALMGAMAGAWALLVVLDPGPVRAALADALGQAGSAAQDTAADWRAMGWVWPAGADGGAVQWDMVQAAAPACLAAVLVAMAGLMLNVAGLEIAQRRELDTRSVLARGAAVQALAGLSGGAPVYLSSTSTQMAMAMGGTSCLIPLTLCALLLAGAVAAPHVFGLVPTFVTAGLLLHLGGAMLLRWVVRPAGRGSRGDSAVTVAILAASLAFGIVWAVALGLLASMVLFAVAYARLPVVRRSDTLSGRRSTVDRGPADTARLDALAYRVRIVTLEGFLFFGTVRQISGHLRSLLSGPRPPAAIILDMRAVQGADAAVLAAFARFDAMVSAAGATLTLAGCSPALARMLDRWTQAEGGASPSIARASDPDSALEAAEERLLQAGTAPRAGPADDIRSALRAARATEAQIDRLMALMEREAVPAGTRLIAAGDPSGDVFILDRGRLAVRTAAGQRLRSFGPGAVVGELASYLGSPRTADVVAETDAVVFRASPGAIEAEGARDPVLAALWHRAMARVLADKLHRTTRMLGDG